MMQWGFVYKLAFFLLCSFTLGIFRIFRWAIFEKQMRVHVSVHFERNIFEHQRCWIPIRLKYVTHASAIKSSCSSVELQHIDWFSMINRKLHTNDTLFEFRIFFLLSTVYWNLVFAIFYFLHWTQNECCNLILVESIFHVTFVIRMSIGQIRLPHIAFTSFTLKTKKKALIGFSYV